MLLLVVVSRAKHLRSATILEEDVEDEDEDEDDVEAKPLAATRRANMNFLMEQKTLWEKNLRLPHKTARTRTQTHRHTQTHTHRERERGCVCVCVCVASALSRVAIGYFVYERHVCNDDDDDDDDKCTPTRRG